jgi:hypothetical protein
MDETVLMSATGNRSRPIARQHQRRDPSAGGDREDHGVDDVPERTVR